MAKKQQEEEELRLKAIPHFLGTRRKERWAFRNLWWQSVRPREHRIWFFHLRTAVLEGVKSAGSWRGRTTGSRSREHGIAHISTEYEKDGPNARGYTIGKGFDIESELSRKPLEERPQRSLTRTDRNCLQRTSSFTADPGMICQTKSGQYNPGRYLPYHLYPQRNE